MTLIVENGTGVANANSYVSVADFVSWADGRGIVYPAIPELEQKILRSMDFIESLHFVGQKHEETQSLQWPRDYVLIDGYSVESNEIPKEVKVAVYESVKLEIENDSKMTPSERETVSETIGDISVTYANSSGMKRETPALTKALRKITHSSGSVSRA
jgi:hypothetical protein